MAIRAPDGANKLLTQKTFSEMKVKKCFLIARTGLGHCDMRQFKQDISTKSTLTS